ncbi:Transposase, partial [Desulfonatronum zhilinae]
HLDTEDTPTKLMLEIGAERGALYPCPKCGSACKAHDFKEYTWRHLNFFQHHCYLSARVPRIDCPEHGIRRVEVPWAREGSRFTLLFEQVVMSLVREMPVNAVARHVEVTDKRLWRIVRHYVSKAIAALDLKSLKAVGLDETASKRGHNYITVFIDLDRTEKPVIFATPGKGKEGLAKFCSFIEAHGGHPDNVIEVVCDMSPAFLSAIEKEFKAAKVTVDWFHVVQLFTRAVDDVRKLEAKQTKLPEHTRWTVLKGGEKGRTEGQENALLELVKQGFATAKAYRVKELLRWIRQAETKQAARWRITHFLKHAAEYTINCPLLEPVRSALASFERHLPRIINRWHSLHTNARLEGFNGLFQAARARARGYRNVENFIMIVYLIAAPIQI